MDTHLYNKLMNWLESNIIHIHNDFLFLYLLVYLPIHPKTMLKIGVDIYLRLESE